MRKTRSLLPTLALALVLALAMAFAVALPKHAAAQTYPDRPVRLVVPFPPGGATDVTARIFAAELTTALKQPVVVENRPGASGSIGIDQVAKSAADGYTLGVSGVGPTAVLPIIDAKLPYSPARDLEVVAGLSAVDFILVARPDFAPATLGELIAYAKAHPGKVTYSSAGVAGPQQLMIEHLAMLSGTKFFHVPYTGDSPAVAAVASGEVDVALAGAASALGLIKAGKLKALAAGAQRLAALPDLATMAEQTGFADFAGYTWNILVAPKGTPPAVVARLNAAIDEIARMPAIQERLLGLGLRPMPGSAQQISAVVASDVARYRRIIEATGTRRE